MAKCTVTANEGGSLGKHVFVGTPRIGEEILIRLGKRKSHAKYLVENVIRRAEGPKQKGRTFVFVSKA